MVESRKYYKGLPDLCKRVKSLKTISEWTVEEGSDRIILRKKKDCFQLPEFEVIIDDSLGFTILVYGWFLPEDHQLYTQKLRSMNNVTVPDLLREIECQLICPGVQPIEFSGQIIPHVIPRTVDPLYCDDEGGFDSFPKKQFWRTADCSLLCNPASQHCDACMDYSNASDLKVKAKQRRLSEPAHLKAPVANTAPERLKLTLQMQRLKCSELEHQLEKMKQEIKNSSVLVDHELSNDLTSIIGDCASGMTAFMNLFWQQQKKLLKSSATGVRYHPMLIRFCLSLAAKSPSCYEELQNSRKFYIFFLKQRRAKPTCETSSKMKQQFGLKITMKLLILLKLSTDMYNNLIYHHENNSKHSS